MVRVRHLVLFVLALIAGFYAFRQVARSSTPAPVDPVAVRREVLRVLDHGARAWNRGDLDDFLSDYMPDDATTFVGRDSVLHGMTAIRGVYAARFAPGARRDSLHFERPEVDILGPDVVNLIAWYVLMRGDSVTQRGPTSLVMRRVNGRWRIIHDHSS
ncbi:MAG TPA: SgcJ/EcaC family oxidoreductase [Gemmatimonadaceae bacterium]|nr:SgcJ/EcaC family oxidoreductase [Gemmatimonadaceae bacterium]